MAIMVDLQKTPLVGILADIRQESEEKRRRIEEEERIAVAIAVKEKAPPKGTPIAIAGAGGITDRYHIDGETVRRWHRRGLVTCLREGKPLRGGAALYDEHDIFLVIASLGEIRAGTRTDRKLKPLEN